jgi:hypothetical protein
VSFYKFNQFGCFSGSIYYLDGVAVFPKMTIKISDPLKHNYLQIVEHRNKQSCLSRIYCDCYIKPTPFVNEQPQNAIDPMS